MRTFLLFFVITFFVAKAAFATKDSSRVTITFNNKVGKDLLVLGKTYSNPFNEPFAVSRFKYYISEVAFYTMDGAKQNISSSYFLVNQEDSASKSFTVTVKAGTYNKISFVIGVDSIKNVSGTQTDALDPINGMFWTWNSGYIMAKLEATSALSKSPNQMVEYHIGGFRKNQNTVRRVTLNFTASQVMKPDKHLYEQILIEADVNKWFKGKHDLKIAEHTTCMTPGDLAVKFADNYADMFKIASIQSAAKDGVNE